MTALPPLLMLAQGRRPKPRKAPAVRQKEITLHMAIAKLLREQWTHIPSGEIRDVRTAAKLKQMGPAPRVARFHLGVAKRQAALPRIEAHWRDAFRASATISALVHHARHALFVAYSIDHVLVALDCWQCLLIKIGGQP